MTIAEKWVKDDFTIIKTGKGKTFSEEDAEEGTKGINNLSPNYPGWITSDAGMKWTHKDCLEMFVEILPQGTGFNILHTHPAPGSHQVIVQPVDHTDTLAQARVIAGEHLDHWSDSSKWESDQDYGKLGA